MPTTTDDKQPARYPPATIRLRYGRKTLRHGMTLGWRTTYPEAFPVTVTFGKNGNLAESSKAESTAA